MTLKIYRDSEIYTHTHFQQELLNISFTKLILWAYLLFVRYFCHLWNLEHFQLHSNQERERECMWVLSAFIVNWSLFCISSWHEYQVLVYQSIVLIRPPIEWNHFTMNNTVVTLLLPRSISFTRLCVFNVSYFTKEMGANERLNEQTS